MLELYICYGVEDVDNSYLFFDIWLLDVVVINFGMNDFNYFNICEFVDLEDLIFVVVKFVEKIYSYFGKSKFFFVLFLMLNDSYFIVEDVQYLIYVVVLKVVIVQMEDVEVYFVDWLLQGLDVGCDYYLNVVMYVEGVVILEMVI